MAGTIAGHGACIKWQYYTAAAIQGYRVSRDDRGVVSLVATVVHHDRYKITQRPLIFEATHKHGAWRWPIESLTIADNGRLVARLGPEIPGNLCLDS